MSKLLKVKNPKANKPPTVMQKFIINDGTPSKKMIDEVLRARGIARRKSEALRDEMALKKEFEL